MPAEAGASIPVIVDVHPGASAVWHPRPSISLLTPGDVAIHRQDDVPEGETNPVYRKRERFRTFLHWTFGQCAYVLRGNARSRRMCRMANCGNRRVRGKMRTRTVPPTGQHFRSKLVISRVKCTLLSVGLYHQPIRREEV